jgi:hypothetical protein
MIYVTVRSINALFKQKLFKSDLENPHLRYPVVNTEKEYHKAHAELFKLIGRDSLDKDVLLEILQQKLHTPESELVDNNRRLKGQWGLFKVLISKVPQASFEPFQNCHDARTMDAHTIPEVKLSTEDLTEKFRQDCVAILKELIRLKYFLEDK